MERISVSTPREAPPADIRQVPPITTRQKEYILSLAEKRMLDPEVKARLLALVNTFSRQQASRTIDWLLAQPVISAASSPTATQISGDEAHSPGADSLLPDIPEGRYAVENANNVLAFYKVSRPTEGKWAGWTFVDVYASDERHPIKGMAAKRTILEKIQAAGVKAAAERYGQEIGACSICGRTLTDETSRSIGIGPICRQRSEWY